ncbi:MAG: rRNA cytosine-C5-methylase [Rhodospirillaceae bacterium]|nr:rRNA cytosine-C5-methylase [Rhodospirillaceae bacterium]
MTPAARIKAAIELLAEIAATGRPADRTIGQYLRTRRFIGGGDRRAITERVYDVLRRRGSLSWRLDAVGADDTPVLLLAAALKDELGETEAVAALFDGSRYGPPPLTAEEARAIASLPAEDAAMPAWARLNYPEWLEPAVEARFGVDRESEMAALNAPATLDLRVNLLKADRETVRAMLAEDGYESTPTPFSPWGLRIAGRPPVASHKTYREGLVEVQDEGAQLVALLAEPDGVVVDYCAGAGGKTLALAAAMGGRGRLVACDSDAERLARMAPRLSRSGVAGVETVVLRADGALPDLQGQADRVLLDMPCSGTGTWRRNPDAKWRLTPEKLAGYVAEQRRILDRAAPLVKPGGRIVYATCSFLLAENDGVVAEFLQSRDDFAPLRVADVWARTIGGECPAEGDFLSLSPYRHGTDAFFVAILERTGP